ncbi:hypothetical protein PENTCL1PPCAC_15202 [Pristionchus entomophagus]|uniref:G protein-coupled receptor n=1 Tax=Pristionchus entomophagus TaxID=358040 RepID=A0AAV5TBU3_9BILA|nr:hypothetical protein PENTCL1PPCAC_15202 [Pristionchus entomophagus]
MYSPDLYAFCLSSYSVLTVVICFFLMIILRRLTINRFARYEGAMSTNTKSNQTMLNKALCVQLAASSLFFISCAVFSANLALEQYAPEFAFTSVPISNLQNMLTPLTTLYFIKPYRRFIVQSLRSPLSVHKVSPTPLSSSGHVASPSNPAPPSVPNSS